MESAPVATSFRLPPAGGLNRKFRFAHAKIMCQARRCRHRIGPGGRHYASCSGTRCEQFWLIKDVPQPRTRGTSPRAGGLGRKSATSADNGRKVTYGYRATPSEAHRGIERDKAKPKRR